MADYATKKDVEEIVTKAVNRAADDLSEIIGNFAQQVDTRFNKVETDIAKLDRKYDHLITVFDTSC